MAVQPGSALRALVVDAEPARGQLARLLVLDPRIGRLRCFGTAAEAIRAMSAEPVDVIFCGSQIRGLDGPNLSRALTHAQWAPQLVLVGPERPAGSAGPLHSIGHLTAPIRADRLAEIVARLAARTLPAGPVPPAGSHSEPAAGPSGGNDQDPNDEAIVVELAGVSRVVHRSAVRYVEAHGDYARLHTTTGSHLVRIPLSTLQERWAAAGFVRIHRSTLVSLPHVDEVRTEAGHCAVRLGELVLPVSRRHTRELRDRFKYLAATR